MDGEKVDGEKIVAVVVGIIAATGLVILVRDRLRQGRAEVPSRLGPQRTLHIRYRQFGLLGTSPGSLGFMTLMWTLVAAGALPVIDYFGGPAGQRVWAKAAIVVFGTLTVFFFVQRLRRVVTEGVVVHRRIIEAEESGSPDTSFIAVDDGRRRRTIDGMIVTAAQYQSVIEGNRVRVVTTGWPCRVLRVVRLDSDRPDPEYPPGLLIPPQLAQRALAAPVEMAELPPLSDADGVIEGVRAYIYAPVGRLIGHVTPGDRLQIYEASTMDAAERMVRVLAEDVPESKIQDWKRGQWSHALLHVHRRGDGAVAFKIYRDINQLSASAHILNQALRRDIKRHRGF